MRLTTFEKTALAVLTAALAVAFFLENIIFSVMIFFIFPLGVFVLLALAGLVLAGIWAAFANTETSVRRLRTALAMPVALALAAVLAGPFSTLGSWTQARVHLARHHADYDAQVARSAPRAATVFPYRNGLLGSGMAIVHADHAPTAKDLGVVLKDMGGCHRLTGDYHLCRHG